MDLEQNTENNRIDHQRQIPTGIAAFTPPLSGTEGFRCIGGKKRYLGVQTVSDSATLKTKPNW